MIPSFLSTVYIYGGLAARLVLLAEGCCFVVSYPSHFVLLRLLTGKDLDNRYPALDITFSRGLSMILEFYSYFCWSATSWAIAQ